MRTGISFTVSSYDRDRLQAIVSQPSSPQKHVWRCRIVLLSADGLGTTAIMAETSKSKTCVWRWQERFMAEGVDGLLREKTRPPGTPKTPDEKVAEVIRLTQDAPPHEATHWTIRAMGKAVGLAASTVRDIWKAHGLADVRVARKAADADHEALFQHGDDTHLATKFVADPGLALGDAIHIRLVQGVDLVRTLGGLVQQPRHQRALREHRHATPKAVKELKMEERRGCQAQPWL